MAFFAANSRPSEPARKEAFCSHSGRLSTIDGWWVGLLSSLAVCAPLLLSRRSLDSANKPTSRCWCGVCACVSWERVWSESAKRKFVALPGTVGQFGRMELQSLSGCLLDVVVLSFGLWCSVHETPLESSSQSPRAPHLGQGTRILSSQSSLSDFVPSLSLVHVVARFGSESYVMIGNKSRLSFQHPSQQ